jgi:tetratricopeptide repeat protein 21B
MQDGMNEFRGTSEEVRFIIANANFALKRGDATHALTLLGTVTSEKPYFVKSQTTMADVYLTHRNDKRMYIHCYRKLAETDSSVHGLLLLGDAYMRIQEVIIYATPRSLLIVYSLKKPYRYISLL